MRINFHFYEFVSSSTYRTAKYTDVTSIENSTPEIFKLEFECLLVSNIEVRTLITSNRCTESACYSDRTTRSKHFVAARFILIDALIIIYQ